MTGLLLAADAYTSAIEVSECGGCGKLVDWFVNRRCPWCKEGRR